MSEIKDNKDIEEVKESEARYNKPCKPDNLCCTCKDGPTVVKNESQCKEQCCKPKTVRCPDIREAKCIPALIDRIYDYVHLDNEQTRCAKDKTFEIIWAGTNDRANLIGKEVCINTITLQYDCLGIKNENIETEYNPEHTHDIWEESDEIDEKTLKEFTEKFVSLSQKGEIPNYLGGLISALKNSKGELPWNLYLKKLMGTVESNRKKTITRRNRRQPNRLDLRGELRGHKAEIAVAIDTSGSISDEEFKQAIKEVLQIVKNYNHEITIIECDNEIRRTYKVKSVKDIKERINIRGGTKFTPVFEYANKKKLNLLVYFTDGKGEDRLEVIPRGYKVLWVISGRGDKLSLNNPYGAVKKLSKVEVKEDTIDMSDVRDDGYSMNNQQPML